MKLLISLATIASLALQANAATVPLYGQCGGQGYTGPTECDPGLICYYWAPYRNLRPVQTVVTSSVGYTTCSYTTTWTTYITIEPTTTATPSTSVVTVTSNSTVATTKSTISTIWDTRTTTTTKTTTTTPTTTTTTTTRPTIVTLPTTRTIITLPVTKSLTRITIIDPIPLPTVTLLDGRSTEEVKKEDE
ncbi:hypothetical protein M407DRAFT_28895 [Tulasnella calospora MUT 4182]|uniref:CBM1 domain-containing protein n=1 Tax=Tulasnella calospora MUT 4182 TaxID=1051891 RepID=A0A0C3KJ68_9AGAM|nr:hypothetical protein M407DRAFT_28895 [Tulasnella calospora MUT 4182]